LGGQGKKIDNQFENAQTTHKRKESLSFPSANLPGKPKKMGVLQYRPLPDQETKKTT